MSYKDLELKSRLNRQKHYSNELFKWVFGLLIYSTIVTGVLLYNIL